jgi:hypothetical protein
MRYRRNPDGRDCRARSGSSGYDLHIPVDDLGLLPPRLLALEYKWLGF